MSEQEVPPVMNVEEIADYLRVAPATIYRLAKRGDLPGAKVGRSWRFQKEVIDDWLREQAGVDTASAGDGKEADDLDQ